jgi:hypothetical protein
MKLEDIIHDNFHPFGMRNRIFSALQIDEATSTLSPCEI